MANNYPYYSDGQRGRRGTENSSVQDAQSLLSMYPMSSATPTSHVIRHVDSMAVSAPPPSFAQPEYYSYQQSSYPQGNPPPYSEHAQEIAYMSGPPVPNDGGYWQNTRNQAIGYVQQQAGSSYPFPASSSWSHSDHPSNYPTSHLAQSMFNHSHPASAYPTPPPPSSSSSSLAGALGPMEPRSLPPPQPPRQQQPQQPQQKNHYPPEQSSQFFNNFVDQKARQLSAMQPPKSVPTTPHRPTVAATSESPDPLALKTTSMTPRKRKPVVEITSPFVKRHKEMFPSTPQRPRMAASTSVTPSSSYSPSSAVPRTPTTVSSSRSTSVSTTTSTGKRKAWTLDCIQVPSANYLTPTSARKSASSPSILSSKKVRVDESPDELGGYGTENDDMYFSSPSKGGDMYSPTKASGRRAGDRDDRAPLEKLVQLLQDIFDAEDSLPSEADSSDIPISFFSAQSPDPSQPHLNEHTVRKLTKYIGHVARPRGRARTAAGGHFNTPRKARMTEVDAQMLSRILKILTRSVKVGEDVDPFMHSGSQAPSSKASPKKASTKKGKKKSDERRSKSATPGEGEDGDDGSKHVLTDLDFDKLTQKLLVSRDSVLAAECCLALLGSDRLTKQLYSEEMITSCLNSIKNQLTRVVYPFVEASSESTSGESLLHRLTAKNASSSSQTETPRRLLGEIFQGLCAVLPRISILINSDGVAMSDSIIIQVVYIAIGPFFVIDSGLDGDSKGKGKEKESSVIRTFGKSGMRGLRLDALALIRSIFANHQDQRSWIIEEILSSLIKLSDTKQKAGQFRLRDGRSIRTVSALLLQLVQTSAHDVRVSAKKIEKARQQKLALKRQESFNDSQTSEPFLDEHDKEEIQLYTTGLESATKAAHTIILFLTQRSGKTKTTKNSNEAEYRIIFDNLISDVLVVLFWPEWPAASLLLSIACKYMVNFLDDVKTSHKEADNNAAKTIALDHLGIIAARIRSTSLKVQQEHEESRGKKLLKPMEEIVKNNDVASLDKLLAAHRDVAMHLSKRASDDQAYDSAQELTAATLGQELANALKKANRWVSDGQDDDDDEMNIRDGKKDFAFGVKLKEAMRAVWKDQADIFDMGSSEEANRIDRIAEEIGSTQGLLRNSFQPVLNVILSALDAPAVFMRTKALRALGQIVTSDASILSFENVRHAIEAHLLDQSSAVRDAAVELIGKYMIDSPEVASHYYPKIAERIADTGLGVRKRVIKLLKSFYVVTDSVPRQVDIATKMVLRMLDEDDTVKELAMKTVEELWFSTPLPSALKSSKAAISHGQNGDAALVNKVAVIMGVAGSFKDRHSPLEDLLHKIMAEKEGAEASALHAKYSELCGVLIDGLVDASDLPGFTVINCVRTIHLLASAYPSIITSSSASTLLPYLKNPTNAEEYTTSDYILKIFRASIPHMPKTAAKFGQELQQTLQPMIIKPSSTGGISALQETVACICVVVQHLTHDFGRLVALLKSCNARLQDVIKKENSDIRTLPPLIFIVSLLVEHFSFDRLREQGTTVPPEVIKNLNSISPTSIIEHVYNTLLELHKKFEPLQPRILQCLGFLFRAQPTLMVIEKSAHIMDSVFASSDEEERGRMLKIMQDFLVAESNKHAAKEKETTKRSSSKPDNVNMEELVGNTEGFADSGVSSAVVQRYLTHILEAALSQNPHIQASAIDIMSFTIKQGLAHPLQSFPVIVALETSPIASISNRASALHSILHGKHASLLNTRFVVSARASFDYQCKIAPGGDASKVKGYRIQTTGPVAVLHRWYSLVREKRPNRQDFLKALVKVFNHDSLEYRSSQNDIDFVRFMAENFSALDYKTQEEVLTVIRYLTNILSTTGSHILEMLSPSHLLTSIRGPTNANAAATMPPVSSSSADATTGVAAGPEEEAQAQVHQDQQEEDEVMRAIAPPQSTPAPAPAAISSSLNSGDDNKIPLSRTSVTIAIVMLLKAHLKTLYGLSEDKCSKFVLGKKSNIGDRPATKKHDRPISWNRLPFATKPILTSVDADEQKQTFIDIWMEDGVTAEPEDEFEAAAT
ncbi:Sister chromatid cohesion protein 2 [Stygiomarasmius scandens]|uniref:Sister chromatid cohesion protein n=1 Tax=Marasmiellus scandens TaxID=2682957 RepID=A0ABR1K048_9AGAR